MTINARILVVRAIEIVEENGVVQHADNIKICHACNHDIVVGTIQEKNEMCKNNTDHDEYEINEKEETAYNKLCPVSPINLTEHIIDKENGNNMAIIDSNCFVFKKFTEKTAVKKSTAKFTDFIFTQRFTVIFGYGVSLLEDIEIADLTELALIIKEILI